MMYLALISAITSAFNCKSLFVPQDYNTIHYLNGISTIESPNIEVSLIIHDHNCTVVFFIIFSVYVLTLILMQPKVIAFATSIEPGQTAHPCCLTWLYTVCC